ncbi:PepSY-associated transmembrane protein [Lutibacter oceani]|uniref:PepSY-associated transmembrane protein n=1 Tax=Lutibacter oceani TaxID=1853311 RepID=A0A3D9S2Q7_9FLAO|nr:PepSY domain-containing protein [Lutibacter oceani]REE83155.1 PepSY-associated transmembrane protein [Lutibacter oceani]
MKSKKSTNFYMRIIHRYLGFFLIGIMIVYALSGTVLIFRNTDAFKVEKQNEKKLQPGLEIAELGKMLRIRDIKIEKTENNILYFNNGTYNNSTGVANYTSKELPFVLDKMTHLHKATTDNPLYWLNIFFGLSLLFFAVSSFWMFLPKTKTFKKGMYFTLGGVVLTLILIFI